MARVRLRIRWHRRVALRALLSQMLLSAVLLAALTLNPARATAPSSPPSASVALGVRQFYLTKKPVEAYQAPTACAQGYHFASLWEMADPSSLQYNTSLGLTSADSGAGPPTAIQRVAAQGWVRTGYEASLSGVAGRANCNAWRSGPLIGSGTVASLPSDWAGGEQDVGVWNVDTRACDTSARVWCVQDDSVLRAFLPLVLRNR
jgi:hypothetical protein